MIDLVTVTCEFDKQMMQLQAESVGKFVEPCVHHVIVNDINVDKDEWLELLSPYYKNHQLNLIFPEWNKYKCGGYRRQQVYKLTVSRYLTDDYVALDTKNFFVKPVNTEEWRNVIGTGALETSHTERDKWMREILLYATYFKRDTLTTKNLLPSETPFVFDPRLIKENVDMNQLEELLMSEVTANEMVYYSYLNQETPVIPTIPYQTLWKYDSLLTVNDLNQLTKNLKVFGIHRDFLKSSDPETLSNINQWLRSLGLCNQVT